MTLFHRTRHGGRLRAAVLSALTFGALAGCTPDSDTTPRAPAQDAPPASEATAQVLATLRRVGPLAATDREAMSKLEAAIQDPRPEVSDQAGYWLAKAGPTAVPILTRVLAHPSPRTRTGACYALGLIGGEARAAVPALLQQLAGTDDSTANMADWALSQILPRGRAHLLPELRALRYGNEFERVDAASRLGILRDSLVDPVPILIRALADNSGLVAESAGNALVRLGSRTVPALQAALASGNALVRARALLVLDRLRPYSHF